MVLVDPSSDWTDPATVVAGLSDRGNPISQRRALLPADPGRGPAATRTGSSLRAVRRGGRRHRAHRRQARRLEGAGRARTPRWRASPSSTSGSPTPQNGDPQPAGRQLPAHVPAVAGRVVWGARTLRGARRAGRPSGSTCRCAGLALFIEESLFRGTQWVVFEPNDEPLWAQIRLNVGAFMHEPVPPGRLPGHHARARPTSSSATRRRRPRTTSTAASSTSSSASRR